jgi:HEAT repeat protein
VSPTKRVVAYHIARLQDKNAEARLKAIKELELLGDVEALDALREVYASDSDIDVRRAAQEAGRSIFLRQQATQK